MSFIYPSLSPTLYWGGLVSTAFSCGMAANGLKQDVFDRYFSKGPVPEARKELTIFFAICIYGSSLMSSSGTLYNYFKKGASSINFGHYAAGVLSWGALAKAFSELLDTRKKLKEKKVVKLLTPRKQTRKSFVYRSLQVFTKIKDGFIATSRETRIVITKNMQPLKTTAEHYHRFYQLMVISASAQAIGYLVLFPFLFGYYSKTIHIFSKFSLRLGAVANISGLFLRQIVIPYKEYMEERQQTSK